MIQQCKPRMKWRGGQKNPVPTGHPALLDFLFLPRRQACAHDQLSPQTSTSYCYWCGSGNGSFVLLGRATLGRTVEPPARGAASRASPTCPAPTALSAFLYPARSPSLTAYDAPSNSENVGPASKGLNFGQRSLQPADSVAEVPLFGLSFAPRSIGPRGSLSCHFVGLGRLLFFFLSATQMLSFSVGQNLRCFALGIGECFRPTAHH